MTPLAVIRSYDDLADALAVERKRQGISGFQLEIEGEMQAKQINKLEKKKKYPGKYLKPWMDGLGVVLVLVRQVEMAGSEHKNCPANPSVYRLIRKKVASKGGRARGRNLSSVRRRESARNAARARWKRKGRGK